MKMQKADSPTYGQKGTPIMNETYIFDLQMFADGGAGAAGGDGGGAAAASGISTGVDAPAAGERGKRTRENPLANVQYGRQPQASAPQEAPATPAPDTDGNTEPTKPSFDELISGEYKDDFGAKVQEIIQKRFKNNADSEAKLESMSPLLELLGKKYNVDPSDIDQMTKIIGDDDSLYEQEAMDRGMSVEALKMIKNAERENARLQAFEQKTLQEQKMQQHFNMLSKQAEEARKLYPGLNLMAEMQNPTFARLTAPGVGVDVRTAYEVAHRDELRGAEMQYAAQKSAERMANAIRANGKRPVENGLSGQQGNSTVKSDPTTLTRADRDEIKRRVRNGEKIVF